MPARVVEYRQLLYIIAMFMIVQFFGILLATQVFSGATYADIYGAQASSGFLGSIVYIASILLFTILIIIFFKFYKGEKAYVVMDLLIVGSAAFIFFIALISSIFGSALQNLLGNTIQTPILLASAVLAIGLAAAKIKMPGLRNLTAMIASIGVGLVLGLAFGFVAALLFMTILAIYDFIAVFITKHMVALGKMAVEKNLSLMIMASEVEAIPLEYLSKEERKEFMEEKEEISKRGGIFDVAVRNRMAPVAARTALGTGDLAVPLMMAISAYKFHLDFALSFVVILGSTLGIIITMYVLKRYKRPLPAIPFLLLGILIALGTYFGLVSLAGII